MRGPTPEMLKLLVAFSTWIWSGAPRPPAMLQSFSLSLPQKFHRKKLPNLSLRKPVSETLTKEKRFRTLSLSRKTSGRRAHTLKNTSPASFPPPCHSCPCLHPLCHAQLPPPSALSRCSDAHAPQAALALLALPPLMVSLPFPFPSTQEIENKKGKLSKRKWKPSQTFRKGIEKHSENSQKGNGNPQKLTERKSKKYLKTIRKEMETLTKDRKGNQNRK